MNKEQMADIQVGDKLVWYGNTRQIHTVTRTTPQYVYTNIQGSSRLHKQNFRLAKNSEVAAYERRQQTAPVG